MKKIKISLAWQIVIALILGILLGSFLHYSPEYRDALVNNLLTPLGSIFINLIKMIVIPLVVSMLILGIANASHGSNVGRLGFRTILYFEIITTIAIIGSIVIAIVCIVIWYWLGSKRPLPSDWHILISKIDSNAFGQ